MEFKNIEEIKSAGFKGFMKISELFNDTKVIPKTKGVYMVLNLDVKVVDFLEVGTGGFFKQKNPNVEIETLKQNWIEDSIVVYIGKAGGGDSKATLQTRLKQYLDFGKGKNIGHWGGRYIWQLKNAQNLVICWKELPNEDPRSIEVKLIENFKSIFKNRPFANLTN